MALTPQLNLKFEIEVLCKNLSLDINDLKPGNLLKDKEKLKNLEEQLSAPKKETKPPEELLPVVTSGTKHQRTDVHALLASAKLNLITLPPKGVHVMSYDTFSFPCLFYSCPFGSCCHSDYRHHWAAHTTVQLPRH